MLESAKQIVLLAFLTDAMQASRIADSRKKAVALYARLEDDDDCYNAAREISKICDEAERWGGSWVGRSSNVRDLLAEYFSRREKTPLEKLGMETSIGIEISKSAFWKAYEERFKAVAATANRESKYLDCVGHCDLEKFFDLFDLPVEKDDFEDLYGKNPDI